MINLSLFSVGPPKKRENLRVNCAKSLELAEILP